MILKEDYHPLLTGAMSFMYVYFYLKNKNITFLPEFCHKIEDDELLIRVLLKKDQLHIFLDSFYKDTREEAYKYFLKLLQSVEKDMKTSLSESRVDVVVQ